MSTTELPARTLDTMSEAIAISSPNGRMSKRSKDAAVDRLGRSLFGDQGLAHPTCVQPSESQRLLLQARDLRELASRGMSVRKFTKAADELERRSKELAN